MSGKFHKHYDIRNLCLDDKKALCHRAKELSYEWWVDKLDCNESFHRQRIEMSFDEIIEMLDDESHFVFIHRIYSGDYLEVGFCTLAKQPDYFLWIQLETEFIPQLMEEFDIREYNAK